MPNVEEDTKLDFKDVLLRPKRSKIKSRADVSSKTLFSNEMANHIYFKPALYFYFQSFEISILTQVDLRRTFKFHNSKGTHQGVPIIASNMDTVGTFEMAAALAKVKDVNVSLILFPSTFVFSFKKIFNFLSSSMVVILVFTSTIR